MRKWTASFILVLHVCQFGNNAATSDGDNYFDNFFLEDSLVKSQCDLMQLKTAEMDEAMVIDQVPVLDGQWVSEECEERPMFKFLLRSYSFQNDTFVLRQHFYEEDSCTHPSFTLVVWGTLTPIVPYTVKNWSTPFTYHLKEVTVVPHSIESAGHFKRLPRPRWKRKCKLNHNWKPQQAFTVYEGWGSGHISDEAEFCLTGLVTNFGEVTLIRTQSRLTGEGKRNRELVLRFTPRLLKSDQAHNCPNCYLISKGTEMSPPRLLSKPRLPPLPHGQWISRRCEFIATFKVFLTMKISFDSRHRTWAGQLKAYHDPFCANPEGSFTTFASGTYALGPIQSKRERKRKTGTNLNLKLKASYINPLGTITECQKYSGVPKIFSDTSQCFAGKDLSPIVGLIKLEIDNKGTPLLHLGLQEGHQYKPEYLLYEIVLIQCSVFPQ